MGYLLLLAFVVFLTLGIPLAFAMGLATVCYFITHPVFTLLTIPQKMVTGLDSFPLLAVVFFLLTGSLMNHSGSTQRLVNLASVLVGHMTGGLGQINIVANMIVSGMTGSATADTVATGSVLIPTMIRSGLPRGFAAAVTAAGATIGPMVPPSIAFVIVGSIANVSIGRLFLGGVIPAFIMALYFMMVVYLVAKRRAYGTTTTRASLRQIGRAFLATIPALLTLVIIVGGILGGVFTPTEAGAVAAVYAFGLGVATRGLRLASFPKILTEVVVMNASVMFVLAVFNVATWILTIEQVPQTLTTAFTSFTRSPAVFLLITNLVLLVLGTIIEPLPLEIVVAPMYLPLLSAYHINPVHFFVVFVLNIMVGLIHPPIGMNMFIACQIAKANIMEFVSEVWPFLVALLIVLILITYAPALVLFLPNWLMGPGQ